MIQLNGQEIRVNRFPNGETHMPDIDPKYPAKGEPHQVDFWYETDADILNLWFLADHLEWYRNLTIHYMPYSRMDRKVGNSMFTLHAVADLINFMAFNEVKIIEPHSDVTTKLIHRSKALMVSEYLVPKWVMPLEGTDAWLVYPDAGAQTRYGDSPSVFFARTLVGKKTRDFQTGRITGLTIDPPPGVSHTPSSSDVAVIWDDLCSRGGTFMAAGQQLKDMGFGRVVLYVTHLEKTVLDGNLLDPNSPVDAIYCTDTMPWVNGWFDPKIHVFHYPEALSL